LGTIVRSWWRTQTVPALRTGRRTLTRPDTYALLEMMHVVRDAVQVDMRDDAIPFFKDLPAYQLLSYYPALIPPLKTITTFPSSPAPASPICVLRPSPAPPS
jgi:hypothetical protein